MQIWWVFKGERNWTSESW